MAKKVEMIKETENKVNAMVNVKETAKAKKANKVTRYGEVQLGNLLERYISEMIYSDMFDETIKEGIGDYYYCYEDNFLNYMCDSFKSVVFGSIDGREGSEYIDMIEDYFDDVDYHDNDTRTFYLNKGKTCKDVVKEYLKCYVEYNDFYEDLWDQYGDVFCDEFGYEYSSDFDYVRDVIKIDKLNKNIDELIESKFKDCEEFVNSLSVDELDSFICNLPEPWCNNENLDLGYFDELDEDEQKELIEEARDYAIAMFGGDHILDYDDEALIDYLERLYYDVEYFINK